LYPPLRASQALPARGAAQADRLGCSTSARRHRSPGRLQLVQSSGRARGRAGLLAAWALEAPARRPRGDQRPPRRVAGHCPARTAPRGERPTAPHLSESRTRARGAVLCSATVGGAVAPCGPAKAAWRRPLRAWPGGMRAPAPVGRGWALSPDRVRALWPEGGPAVVGDRPPPVGAVDGPPRRPAAERSRGPAALPRVRASGPARPQCRSKARPTGGPEAPPPPVPATVGAAGGAGPPPAARPGTGPPGAAALPRAERSRPARVARPPGPWPGWRSVGEGQAARAARRPVPPAARRGGPGPSAPRPRGRGAAPAQRAIPHHSPLCYIIPDHE